MAANRMKDLMAFFGVCWTGGCRVERKTKNEQTTRLARRPGEMLVVAAADQTTAEPEIMCFARNPLGDLQKHVHLLLNSPA